MNVLQSIFLLIFKCICICSAAPINSPNEILPALPYSHFVYLCVSLTSLLCLIIVIWACACCNNRKRVKLRSISAQIDRNIRENHNELSSFPPTISSHLSGSNSQIYFEPLPDISSQLSNHVKKSVDIASNNEEWFGEPHQNFPRNQLQYIKKLGSGWFGQVLEGRAVGIGTDHTLTAIPRIKCEQDFTPVVVKCLREDATAEEQSYYLQEVLPYKKLDQENIVKVLAYCLDTQPYLILMEYCSKGDLKGVIKREAFSDAMLLKMAQCVSKGLLFMHQNKFVHTDLAARNCLVTSDYTVKLGDYGHSIELYKNEYYLAESIALPLRWCAPETLLCSATTIETVQLNKEANVWSFGVLLWEMLSGGMLPYHHLNNEEVIQKVILAKSVTLSNPRESRNADKINNLLTECWKETACRRDMVFIDSVIDQLYEVEASPESDFERRWDELGISSANGQNISNSDGTSTNHIEVRLSETDENDLDAKVAATFGSVPSWSTQDDSLAEEITDAIKKLDEALAEEEILADDCIMEKFEKPLTDSEEDFLSKRLEQGDFSELVRIKSLSVQDLMCLTVVDDGSDSSDKTSQFGSLEATLVPDKVFSSESNLKEAVRDAGFMLELERLQAEHKYSIISEVSKESGSLEYKSYTNIENEYNEFANETNQEMPSNVNDKVSSPFVPPYSHTQYISSSGNTLNASAPHMLPNALEKIVPDGNSEIALSKLSSVHITTAASNIEPFHLASAASLHSSSIKESEITNKTRKPSMDEENIENTSIEKIISPEILLQADRTNEIGNEYGEISFEDSLENSLESTGKCDDSESGDFWKLQMVAWKEAAEQTRELLNEASVNAKNSPPSSTDNSPFKNSDTYISYDTPVDSFEHDLKTLRSELSLKLSDVTSFDDDEDEQEEIFINYRSGPYNLSPIKEEAGELDDCFDDNASYSSHQSDIVNNSSLQYDIDNNSSHHQSDLVTNSSHQSDVVNNSSLQSDVINNSSHQSNIVNNSSHMSDIVTNGLYQSEIVSNNSHLSENYHSKNDETFVVKGNLDYKLEKYVNETELFSLESHNSLIIEDLENNSTTEVLESLHNEDVLVIDTETNTATLIDSGKPVSHVAFVKEVTIPPDESVEYFEFVDDVAPESIPYESNSMSEKNVERVDIIDESEESDKQNSHYQSYFSSAVNPINQSIPSLEEASYYESLDHASLPYEVNYADTYLQSLNSDSGNAESKLSSESPMRNDANEATILDSVEDESGIVTSTPSKSHNKYEFNSSETMEYFSDSDIDEDITEVGETPKKTPTKPLPNFTASEEDRYTPEWESDGSSSTSGEFVWLPNQNTSSITPSTEKMKFSKEDSYESTEEEEDDDSESGEEEFTPSTWNRELTPQRSLLKSPEINTSFKKSVSWKRQRHHRVYEYPPEPITWHAEEPQQQRRTWGGHSLDYLTLADWHYADETDDTDEQFPCTNQTKTVPSMYNFAPSHPYETSDSMMADDCEFFIRSSGTPFNFNRSTFSTNEFFPVEQNMEFEPSISSQPVGEKKHARESLRLDLPSVLPNPAVKSNCIADNDVEIESSVDHDNDHSSE